LKNLFISSIVLKLTKEYLSLLIKKSIFLLSFCPVKKKLIFEPFS
jgi:hypothetical protein